MGAYDIPKLWQSVLGQRDAFGRRPFTFDDPVTAHRLARDDFSEFLQDELRRGEIMRRRQAGMNDDPYGFW